MAERGRDRRGQGGRDTPRTVVGIHPVRELLRAGRRVDTLLVHQDRSGTPALDELLDLASRARVDVRMVDRERIDRAASGLVHQGVVAFAPPLPDVDLKTRLAEIAEGDEPGLFVAVDGITDPHNVGSIARTAEAVGAHGLIVPKRRAAGLTPTVEKAAAGAFAHLAFIQVPNLVRSLTDCQEFGYWAVGLDADGDTEIGDCHLLTEPVVLVVGSEGGGLARLSQVQCDMLVRLPMRGRVASLNASVAAAVALYEVVRQRARA